MSEKNSYTAVVCPQCGSNKATELEDDQFLCNSCQTIFALDKKKIQVEVNHTHEYDQSYEKSIADATTKKIMLWLGVLFMVIFLLPVLLSFLSLFFSNSQQSNTSWLYSGWISQSTMNERVAIAEVYVYEYENTWYTAVVYFDETDPSFWEWGQGFIALFDSNMKYITKTELISSKKYEWKPSVDIDLIGNALYVRIDKKDIFVINPLDSSILKNTQTLSQDFPELANGIAIVGYQSSNGDGLKLTNANGDEYEYFPKMQKVLPADDAYQQARNKSPKETSYFTFLTAWELNREKYFLQKITANIDIDGLYQKCFKCYELDFAEKSGNTTYIGAIPSPENEKRFNHITNVQAILPDRNFIDPKILAEKNDRVLLSFRTSVAEDAPTQIQLISDTGAILLSQDITKTRFSSNDVMRSEESAVIQDAAVILGYNSDGVEIFPLDPNKQIQSFSEEDLQKSIFESIQ